MSTTKQEDGVCCHDDFSASHFYRSPRFSSLKSNSTTNIRNIAFTRKIARALASLLLLNMTIFLLFFYLELIASYAFSPLCSLVACLRIITEYTRADEVSHCPIF